MQVSAHGTGASIPPVDEMVVSMKLITPAGETLEISQREDPELFEMARVGLGALGVVSEVTLQLVPAHQLLEHTYIMSSKVRRTYLGHMPKHGSVKSPVRESLGSHAAAGRQFSSCWSTPTSCPQRRASLAQEHARTVTTVSRESQDFISHNDRLACLGMNRIVCGGWNQAQGAHPPHLTPREAHAWQCLSRPSWFIACESLLIICRTSLRGSTENFCRRIGTCGTCGSPTLTQWLL